ncbi:MAG: fibronectin type III domain-containing protein [Paludibacter sp.]
MRKNHVVLDFMSFPIEGKIEMGRSVEVKLRGNALFANPDVPVDDIKAATDLLESRNVAAMTGGKESTALMHQAEEDWNKKMRLEALCVDRIADGDSAVILGAGFNLAKQPLPATRPEFSVELGEKSGSVVLRHKRIDGARSYLWQYYEGESPTDNTAWVIGEVTPQASVELSGLTPMTKYWFRVAAVTINGTGEYCVPVMQVVI